MPPLNGTPKIIYIIRTHPTKIVQLVLALYCEFQERKHILFSAMLCTALVSLTTAFAYRRYRNLIFCVIFNVWLHSRKVVASFFELVGSWGKWGVVGEMG